MKFCQGNKEFWQGLWNTQTFRIPAENSDKEIGPWAEKKKIGYKSKVKLSVYKNTHLSSVECKYFSTMTSCMHLNPETIINKVNYMQGQRLKPDNWKALDSHDEDYLKNIYIFSRSMLKNIYTNRERYKTKKKKSLS